jgi:protease-4
MISRRLLRVVSSLALGVGLVAAPAADWALAGPAPAPFLRSSRWVSQVDDATALFVNPAGLSIGRGVEAYLEANFERGDHQQVLGILTAPIVRLGYVHDNVAESDFDTYAFGTGLDIAPFAFGWTTRLNRTDETNGSRATSHDVGGLFRPHRLVSAGFTCFNINDPAFAGGRLERGYAGAFSVRPYLADPERFTATLQADWPRGEERVKYTLAAECRILDGLRLAAHYRTRLREAGVSLSFDFPGTSFQAYGVERSGGEVSPRTAYAIHSHADSYRRNGFPVVKRFADVHVRGPYEDQASGLVLIGQESHSVHRVIQTLDKARKDADVAGAIVTISRLGGGLIGEVTALDHELREAMMATRRAGKPVVAYLEEGGGAAEAYVASAADHVVMPRMARFTGIGVAVELLRLKDAFADLGIDWDARTAGAYKSTFHTHYTAEATEAQREQLESLVHEAYGHLADSLLASRPLTAEARERILSGGLVSAGQALDLKLIDEIGWYEDARRAARRLTGGGADLARLKKLDDRRYWRERWTPPPAVGVVLATGGIAQGESRVDRLFGRRTMGAETVARAIRSAASDPGVKAIVLRVDSGGGSVLASDRIRREILDVRRRRGIPIVVSMGNAAASGGYWISMDADRIFADPQTITGSIGVVFSKPVFERLLEKRDVHREVFKEGELTDMFSPNRPMTDEERSQVNLEIEEIYKIFLDGVAEGRKLSPEKVRSVADGRVWFGSQALGHGLVDEIGTLMDAVEAAGLAAGLDDDYRTLFYTGQKFNLLTRLVQGVEYLKLLGVPTSEGAEELR